MVGTINVDYGVGNISYNVDASEAWTDPTAEQVVERGEAVALSIATLEDSAELAADRALIDIGKLLAFSADVPNVGFRPPPIPATPTSSAIALSTLNTANPAIVPSTLRTNFSWDTETPVSNSFNFPELFTYNPADPPQMSPSLALPTAPAEYSLPNIKPPPITNAVFAPTNISTPALGAITLPTISIATIEPFHVSTDVGGLIDAIERMGNYNIIPPVLPEYLYLLPEVFSVVGSMASGDVIVKYADIMGGRSGVLQSTRGLTKTAFSGRGLGHPVGGYDDWVDSLVVRKLDSSDAVFEAVAIDDCVRSAFQLGTAAHRMLVDIEVALYGLEFSVAKASVNAHLEKAKSVAAIYKAEVLLLQNTISEYNAAAAYITALAAIFESNTDQVEIIGDVNAVTAELFSATESLKGIDVGVYKSRVMAEKAKLESYKAVIDSYKINVSQAEASVAEYAGVTALYATEVDRTSLLYDTYSARVQSVQYENAARAAFVGAEQSQLSSYAAEADSLAATASARSIDLQAEAAARGAAYTEKSLKSDTSAMGIRNIGASYDKLVSNYVSNLQAKSVEFDGKADLANSVSSYAVSVAEAVGRAAQLSQTANIQLANAYSTVYDAAGRAGAAVASGKLSGFRASASLTATERLSSDDSYGVRVSHDGRTSYTESIEPS